MVRKKAVVRNNLSKVINPGWFVSQEVYSPYNSLLLHPEWQEGGLVYKVVSLLLTFITPRVRREGGNSLFLHPELQEGGLCL